MDWYSARTSRRCARKNRRQPVLYTNYLLRCFVHSIAMCLKNSSMITSLTLDGILLTSDYLRILCNGFTNNRNLQLLSLARCRIGDTGCYILLKSLQCNSSLHVLNLSSCCLTNRGVTYLSSFFKKRKADLLQNVWKESTSPRDAETTTKNGLQILILDKNYFRDIGLKPLTRILKSDFWLKTLSLRTCGITQHGGNIMLELLQTNSVLTHIDLRGNEVSTKTLRIIRRILKKRKNKGERISMKKRLLSNKQVSQNIIPQNKFSQCALEENKIYQAQIPETKTQKEMKRKGSKKFEARNVNWTNVDELKNRLSVMIEHNKNLIKTLEYNTNFLMEERNRRLNAEEAFYKMQPRLRNLQNKIIKQNNIHSKIRYESQVYADLQNIFNDLKIFTSGKVLKINIKDFNEKFDSCLS